MEANCDHVPDLTTVHIEPDGNDYYLDVDCAKCGETGCFGRANDLILNIDWETTLCEGEL